MKEKYQLLLEKVIAHSEGKHDSMCNDAFICNRIQQLGSPSLFQDFRSRKPSETKYIEFFNHRLYNKDYDYDNSWWNCEDENVAESNEQRILFLKQIISEL